MAEFQLSEKAQIAGFGLTGFDSIDSTNEEAARQLNAGLKLPHWFAAGEQTKGRGRRGRSWVSQPGNLAATLVVDAPEPSSHRGLLGFVAALAVHDALVALYPPLRERLKLKWPNDCLLDGAKLVGILLESVRTRDHRDVVIIGTGVNLVAAPSGTPYAVVALNDIGLNVEAEDVFTSLADAWVDLLSVWDHGAGKDAVLNRWRALAHQKGDEIVVRTETGQLLGRFEKLDDDGRLVMRLNDGSFHYVTAGDVFFPDAQHSRTGTA